ncbi:MAG: CRTAC1 family protein, partial [Planctomycetes bacterium]|nr:CRTAC1 family protein [Planctomycetota bacterium]
GLNDADARSRRSYGIVAGDYDNDGDRDVFMLARTPNNSSCGVLYRNDGGVFTNVTAVAGVRRAGLTPESVSWVDYDLDGDLDLMLVGTVQPYLVLYRNNADGTFSEQPAALPTFPTRRIRYAHLWMDYDLDGYPDCFCLSDDGAGTNVVLHNVADSAGGRRFENVGDSLGFSGLGPAPMGLNIGDYDSDGDFDFAVSDGVNGTYFRNDGGIFVNTILADTMWGWGIDWSDVDNDGDLDLLTSGSYPFFNANDLRRNRGDGTFDDVSDALNAAVMASQYSVQVDFNNDGRQDWISIAPDVAVQIYENLSTTPGNWFQVQLRGDGRTVSRDAIGAVVRVFAEDRVQIRPVLSGSSQTAAEDPRAHFGLGADQTVDRIEVVWPRRGSLAARTDVFDGPFAANQQILLESALPGDLDRSGCVDLDDLATLLGVFGLPAAAGDVDRDGVVSLADLSLLLSEFGNCR